MHISVSLDLLGTLEFQFKYLIVKGPKVSMSLRFKYFGTLVLFGLKSKDYK